MYKLSRYSMWSILICSSDQSIHWYQTVEMIPLKMRFFKVHSNWYFLLLKNFTEFRWHWFIKLYRFQVYNSIIHHCILYCVFITPNQASFHHHLSPFTLFYLSHFPSGNLHTVICVYEFLVYFLLLLFCFVFVCLFNPITTPLPLW